jgi:hypothetical protein
MPMPLLPACSAPESPVQLSLDTFMPHLRGLRAKRLWITDHLSSLTVAGDGPSAACPRCQSAATRVHSHYERTVADLPWSGVL